MPFGGNIRPAFVRVVDIAWPFVITFRPAFMQAMDMGMERCTEVIDGGAFARAGRFL